MHCYVANNAEQCTGLLNFCEIEESQRRKRGKETYFRIDTTHATLLASNCMSNFYMWLKVQFSHTIRCEKLFRNQVAQFARVVLTLAEL